MKTPKPRRTAEVRKRILIVDDHPIMRQGLALLINEEPDMQVCGEAETANKAIDAVGALSPDLVLADITLPGKSGLDLIKDLQALHPGTVVLILSMHDESMYAERVLRAGGRGYVMKQQGGQFLLESIRKVLAGQIAVSDRMSSKILEIFSGRRNDTGSSPVGKLSDREFEIFQLVGQGKGTKEIAGQLNLSAKTVDVHRLNIKTKLQLQTAGELIHFAVRWIEAERNPKSE